MVAVTVANQRLNPIDELYVFGDSLSDTGTVFRLTGGLYPSNPPYFQGRYSNGRLWVEYLGDFLNLSSTQTKNFAHAGAITGSSSNSLVPGLLAQVELLTRTQPQVNSSALYVLWAGANDYLQGANNATIPVENVTKAIALLASAGAKRILVGNLPNLGELPATRNSANAKSLSALTQQHNQSLRRSLKLLNQQYSDIQLITLDAHKLYREAITNPSQFGFTNVTSSCISGGSLAENPQKFLFWDGIHPTTATHQILASNAFAALEAGLLVPVQI